MPEKDPYELNAEDHRKIKDELKNKSMGVVCPLRNYKKPCKVCDAIKPLWAYPDGSPERTVARQKSPKVTFYANAVFPENPNKVFIFEMGKKLGDSIIDGIHDSNSKWGRFIAHPKAGKGREMIIKKFKGDMGFNTYSAKPDLDLAEYDVPDEALENLFDLDRIGEMMENKELNDDNFMRVSDLKLDESIRVRFLPPWDDKTKVILKYLWRHWGVTKEEVEGTVDVDLTIPKVNDGKKEVKVEEKQSEEIMWGREEKKEGERMPCFGKADFFEPDSTECKGCKDKKACAVAIG